jgi:hypothetical protein
VFIIKDKKLLEQIDLKLLPSERIKKYLEQVSDPYTIIEDGKKIRISFTGKKPIGQILQKYFSERHIAG